MAQIYRVSRLLGWKRWVGVQLEEPTYGKMALSAYRFMNFVIGDMCSAKEKEITCDRAATNHIRKVKNVAIPIALVTVRCGHHLSAKQSNLDSLCPHGL